MLRVGRMLAKSDSGTLTINQRSERRTIKIDAIYRKILAIVQQRANITNQELADLVGLSPAACSQRTNALKEAGYLISFHAEVDLARICEHVLAYVEFTLKTNEPETRARFAAAIEEIPEFMDCLRLSGDVDFISFTCCRGIKELNEVCDKMLSDPDLGIARINQRIIIDRVKWYYGYPLSKLKWLGD